MSTITSVQPLRAVEGGRVTIHGTAFPVDSLLTITVGEVAARVMFASSSRLVVAIPEELDGGWTSIKIPGGSFSYSVSWV